MPLEHDRGVIRTVPAVLADDSGEIHLRACDGHYMPESSGSSSQPSPDSSSSA